MGRALTPSDTFRFGTHTVTGAEATANTLSISTGLEDITTRIVTVYDSGNNVVTSDADVTSSGGVLTVADGSSFDLTENYVIHYFVGK